MSGRTVKGIVYEWLVANGYEGLYADARECGCKLSDLMPCDMEAHECHPGYKGPDPSDEFAFLIGPEKEGLR